jgi:hypothetical protein
MPNLHWIELHTKVQKIENWYGNYVDAQKTQAEMDINQEILSKF